MKRRLLALLGSLVLVGALIPAPVAAYPTPDWYYFVRHNDGGQINMYSNECAEAGDIWTDAVRISMWDQVPGRYVKFCMNVAGGPTGQGSGTFIFCNVPRDYANDPIPELCGGGPNLCACLNDAVTKYTVNYIRNGWELEMFATVDGPGWSFYHNWAGSFPFSRTFIGSYAQYNDKLSRLEIQPM